MNIGITTHIKKSGSIWTNGIMQNCMMLYRLLDQIDFVENVYLLNTGEDFDEYPWPYKNFKIYKWGNIDEITEKFQLIITLGTIPNVSELYKFKSKEGNKIVGYKGGNSLVNKMESIIYGQVAGSPNVKLKSGIVGDFFDEIWMVPQQEYHNKHFYEIQHKTKAKSVPFVWSPEFIDTHNDLHIKQFNKSAYFNTKSFDKWRIASFEPNLSLLKNMIPLIYMAEEAYRRDNTWLDKVIFTNGKGLSTNKNLIETVKGLDSFKDKKLFFDGRYPVVHILANFSEMVISQQWGNPLNYAYLDVVYFGFPLVHNAYLCQDLGYYYEDFKLKDGANQIMNVVKNHKGDDEYHKRQLRILDRYRYDNPESVKQYGLLIQNLWKKNKIENLNYNWKTNLLK